MSHEQAPSLSDVRNDVDTLKLGCFGDSVEELHALLRKEGYDITGSSFTFKTEEVIKEVQSKYGLDDDGEVGMGTLGVLEDKTPEKDWLKEGIVNITVGKLARMGGIKYLLKPNSIRLLNEAMNKYHINTPARACHFFSQGFEECGRCLDIIENLEFPKKKKYYPYIGAGFIQITGEENYQRFADAIDDQNIMCGEGAPQYMIDNGYAFENSGWYWDKLREINAGIDAKIKDGLSEEEISNYTSFQVKRSEDEEAYKERYTTYLSLKKLFFV